MHDADLALWHGLGLPLAFSALALLLGLAIFVKRKGFGLVQASLSPNGTADGAYRLVMRTVDRLGGGGHRSDPARVGGGVPRGDPGGRAAPARRRPCSRRSTARSALVLWDTPAQAVVGLVIILAALFTARSRRRLRAVILAGVTGYGTAMLFVLHGAPDLALTQVLVETTSLVVFVLVLRRLPGLLHRPAAVTAALPADGPRRSRGPRRRADHAGHHRLAYGGPCLRGLSRRRPSSSAGATTSST